MRPLLLALGLLVVAAPAHALDPYMWGVGPRVGTMVIPGSYPWKFPPKIERLRESGDSELTRVRNDISFGADAVYYINGSSRTGLTGSLGFGDGGYFDANALFKYNWVTQTGAMDFLLGGGAGFGTATFNGRDKDERLNVPYYPLRAEASALIRDETRGYQGTVYAQYNLPANHHYWNVDGVQEDVGSGVYLTFGVEVAVYFGDFTPPKPRRRANGGGGAGPE